MTYYAFKFLPLRQQAKPAIKKKEEIKLENREKHDNLLLHLYIKSIIENTAKNLVYE